MSHSAHELRAHNLHARDLRNAGGYLLGLLILAGALLFTGPQLVQRALASSPFNDLPLASQPERTQTRLSVAVDTAREIRAALSKPQPRLEPLQPITAKLAYGHLKPGSPTARQRIKLPKEAMDAMASVEPPAEVRRSYSPAPGEMHRVY